MNESFVFRKGWRDAISGLPAEVRLEVYEAIIEYGLSGTLPSSLKQLAGLAFNFAKADLDRECERKMLISEKRREAGKNHTGNQYAKWNKMEQNGTNGTSVPHMEQMEQKRERKRKEEESPLVLPPSPLSSIPKEKEKEKESESDVATVVATPTHSLELLEKRKKKFRESLVPFEARYGLDMIEDFFGHWTQPNKSHTQMGFELQKTWDTARRLSTWAKNDFGYHHRPAGNAAGTLALEQQRQAVIERDRENEQRSRQRDEWARHSVSHAAAKNDPEYLRALQES